MLASMWWPEMALSSTNISIEPIVRHHLTCFLVWCCSIEIPQVCCLAFVLFLLIEQAPQAFAVDPSLVSIPEGEVLQFPLHKTDSQLALELQHEENMRFAQSTSQQRRSEPSVMLVFISESTKDKGF